MEQAFVEVELADGARFAVESLEPEPGYGFITIRPHPGEGVPGEVIVAVGTIEADRAEQGRRGARDPRLLPSQGDPPARSRRRRGAARARPAIQGARPVGRGRRGVPSRLAARRSRGWRPRRHFCSAYVLPRIDGRTAVFLYELEVAERARRRGLGRALVEEAKRIGREAGAFEMYVLSGVREHRREQALRGDGRRRRARRDVDMDALKPRTPAAATDTAGAALNRWP